MEPVSSRGSERHFRCPGGYGVYTLEEEVEKLTSQETDKAPKVRPRACPRVQKEDSIGSTLHRRHTESLF